ncbi:MAG: hypothetical protein IPM51_04665 [Sphingobacteriaceae bacterium]|nr:hypothetical protein [Sphingobacteriaceae bacterium]
MRVQSAYIIFLFVLTYSSLFGQYNSEFIKYDKMGRSVSVNLDYDLASNGMNNSLLNKLVFGGNIDDDLKASSSKYLNAKNNFGLNLSYDVSAFIKANSKFDFLIEFKNQEILNATYTNDFYNLMFYGNQMYKGRTANLAGSNVNALRFQEVKFGAIIHHFDSVAKIGMSVSFLKGEQLFYLKTNKNSSLFTSGDGSELIFNSDFSMALSDTTQKRLGSFNGVGASADIYFETPYKSKIGKKSILIVNANNIGFIHWRNNSVQYNSDSVLRFSGYHVNNIIDLKDSTLNRINTDSMALSLTNARTEPFNVNIPTNLVIINKIYFGQQKFCLSTGFRHIFNANYKPYVFVEPEFTKDNITASLHTGYGGYGRLNVGLSVTANLKGWYFRVGSNSLQGYVLPASTTGQSLFFSIAKKLK